MAKKEEYVPSSYRAADRFGYYGPDGQYRTHKTHFAKPKVPLGRKASNLWRSLNRPREFVFNAGKGVKVLLLLSLVISGVFIADQLLKPTIASHLGENEIDIFHEDFASNDIDGWNTRLATYDTWVGDESVRLDSNSTHSAVAITKTKFDFSVASAKQLDNMFKYGFFSTTNCCVDHAWFLTRNSTIPVESTTWVPIDDPDVALVVRTVDTGGGGIATTAFIQRQVTRTVAQDDPGGCAEIGSCFVSGSSTITVDTSTKKVANLLLNFTGNPSSSNPFSRIQSGQAASFTTTNVRHLPWFDFQSQQYYIGLWQVHGASAAMAYIGGAVDIRSLNIVVKTPLPTVGSVSGFIESAGWFGPIIRFLIGGTVFILEALSTVLGFLANAILNGLDTMGSFLGLGAIGTAIRDTFTGVITWISNVLSVTVGQALNTATAIGNIITTVVTSASSFFAGVTGVFAEITNLFSYFWSSVANVWKIGTLGFKWVVMADLIAGIMMALHSVAEFQRWVWIQWNIVLGLLRVIMAIGEKVTDLIAKIRTIGPRPVGI